MVLGPSRLCLLLEQVSKAFSKRMAPKTIIDTRYWIFGCTGRIELAFGRLWFLFRDLCKSPFLLRISNFGYKTAPAPPLTLQVNIVASAVFRSKFEMLVDESDFCRGPFILCFRVGAWLRVAGRMSWTWISVDYKRIYNCDI